MCSVNCCCHIICLQVDAYGHSFICGFLLFAGYAFQKFGLILTTPSKSAFITSVSVILVPILLIVLRLQRLEIKIWIVVLFTALGLYILLNPMGQGINWGDIITFGCALSFAFHIIFQDIYIKKEVDIVRFFTMQVFFVFLFSLLSSRDLPGLKYSGRKSTKYEAPAKS